MSNTPIDNIANIRRGFEAFASGDLDVLRARLDPEIVWHVPGRSSLAGDYRGIESTLGYFVTLFERSSGTFKAELVEGGEIGPDLVACLVQITGDMSAGSIDMRTMMLFQERDGRSLEVWNFPSDMYALDEAEPPVHIALPDARKAEAPVRA